MPKPYTGAWKADFLESGNNSRLFEYIGAIAMQRTTLQIQIYRLETLLLGKSASKICGYCSSTQGSPEHSKKIRQAIRNIAHKSIWLRYADLVNLTDSAIQRADLFTRSLWARNPEKPDSFIMVKTRPLMNWHLRHSRTTNAPVETYAGDKDSILAFEYTESEFIDLQSILGFISKNAAAFTIEYESARGFVDQFKVSTRSDAR